MCGVQNGRTEMPGREGSFGRPLHFEDGFPCGWVCKLGLLSCVEAVVVECDGVTTRRRPGVQLGANLVSAWLASVVLSWGVEIC